jgi:hypothetical protein
MAAIRRALLGAELGLVILMEARMTRRESNGGGTRSFTPAGHAQALGRVTSGLRIPECDCSTNRYTPGECCTLIDDAAQRPFGSSAVSENGQTVGGSKSDRGGARWRAS